MSKGNKKTWKEIKLTKYNRLLSHEIDNISMGKNKLNRNRLLMLLKRSTLIIGVDTIPNKSNIVHYNMLSLSPANGEIIPLIFSNIKALKSYSPESQLLAVDSYHIFESCYQQYGNGLFLLSEKHNLKFTHREVFNLVEQWHKE